MKKTTKRSTTSPWANLAAWNPHFRHGNLPPWMRKRIRAVLLAADRWYPGHSSAFQELPRDLFDHWGTIPCPAGGKRPWLYAMPYNDNDDMARAFAKKYSVTLAAIVRPGPWHPATTCYLFAPGDAENAPSGRRNPHPAHRPRNPPPSILGKPRAK